MQKGFTLLEVLVVMVIIGVTAGGVVLASGAVEDRRIERVGDRIVMDLQHARDRAALTGEPLAFETAAEGYRFLHRRWIDEGRAVEWVPLDDGLLGERQWPGRDLQFRLEIADREEAARRTGDGDRLLVPGIRAMPEFRVVIERGGVDAGWQVRRDDDGGVRLERGG
ncbi:MULTISPECIES: prepilin-type N-terminal cleavage/methylation domain-containing protein [unclassified Thioalkalivibrio]|uniref:prepilin-type N-terminal cleavage/methylation domain-containing protein n=1 Tax=unclassified Thioalkalivibrio TaxID=2621013 RepID=UPI000360FF06|nr:MULTISPECIES: prepilin-type N-terminal cleavage/methylation domain-containing protein [unclassified Thioalkalivibrio]